VFNTKVKSAKRLHIIEKDGKLKVARAEAVIIDYIGTLVNANYYNMVDSKRTLHRALVEVGFETGLTEFLEAYAHAHEKYRVVRYEQFREVTNAVWVCEALTNLGCSVRPEDTRIKIA